MSTRDRIKGLEAQGQTGATNIELDALNREQTKALTKEQLINKAWGRSRQGKPIDKLEADAGERGVDLREAIDDRQRAWDKYVRDCGGDDDNPLDFER